jgi:hypothetical protein
VDGDIHPPDIRAAVRELAVGPVDLAALLGDGQRGVDPHQCQGVQGDPTGSAVLDVPTVGRLARQPRTRSSGTPSRRPRRAEGRQLRQIAAATVLDMHFGNSSAPWQRSTNENTNCLLRQ